MLATTYDIQNRFRLSALGLRTVSGSYRRGTLRSRSRSFLFLTVYTFIFLLLMASVCGAAQVTLAWDESEDPQVAGYKLYYGTETGVYNTCVNTFAATSRTVTGLLDGQTYFFVATAYDGEGHESSFSQEVVYTVPFSDTDGDGVRDVLDAFPSNPAEWVDTDGDGIGNNADLDDDQDGMPDEWEIANNLDPLRDDAGGDLDGDGITNGEEYDKGSDPTAESDNRAPYAPLLIAPVNSETVTLTPQLQVDDFSDPDFGDVLHRTQWQIMRAIDDHCVFEVTSTQTTSELIVPRLVLEEDTEYYWRARFYDNHGWPSDWSASAYFVTEYLGTDGDGNGVLDMQEISASADLDEDGALDYAQNDIKCVQLSDGQTRLGLSTRYSQNAAGIISLILEDPADLGDVTGGLNQPMEIPFGLINFKVAVDHPGDEVQISVFFPQPAPAGAVWYKYDPVAGVWTDFSAYYSMSADRKSLQLTLRDGGEGDADGIANGMIVDPAGLAIPPASGSVSDASDSVVDTLGLGGCFISALADRNRPMTSHGWYRTVQGREAAIGFVFVMLLIAGRCAAGCLARMIREKNQMAAGARLRS